MLELLIICCMIVVMIWKNMKTEQKKPSSYPDKPQERQGTQIQTKPVQQGLQSQTKPVQQSMSRMEQEELKQKLLQKYAGKTSELQRQEIPKNKSANTKGNHVVNTIEEQIPVIEKEFTEEQIIQHAEEIADIDLYNIYDIPQMQQNSEYMNKLEDIMVKGIDTRLSFERDFLAEGIDMMNKVSL